MTERFDDLADRLEAIAEELAEAAIDTLKSSLRAGHTKPPVSEKRVTQARRAVEKAAHLLRSLEVDTAADDGAHSDSFD